MQITQNVTNVVVIGDFQKLLPLFDKYFFIKNKFITEDEVNPRSIFDPIGGVNLITDQYQIGINFTQLLIIKSQPSENKCQIQEILSKLISIAEINTITALGMNFHNFLYDENIGVEELSKKYFFNESSNLLNKFFSKSDAQFGTYASVNFKDSRLKLDIKPSILNQPLLINNNNMVSHISGINFGFNFHFDNPNMGDFSSLLKYLSEYSYYQEEVNNIMSLYK